MKRIRTVLLAIASEYQREDKRPVNLLDERNEDSERPPAKQAASESSQDFPVSLSCSVVSGFRMFFFDSRPL